LPPWGLGMASVALLALAVVPPSRMSIGIASAMCGLGFGTVMPSAQIATQMLAGRERLGAAAALLSITRSTGAALGTAAFGGLAFALLNVHGGAGEGAGVRLEGLSPDRVKQAFHLVFGALAVYAAAGAFAASRAPRMDLLQRARPEDPGRGAPVSGDGS
jgi:MFS family permease